MIRKGKKKYSASDFPKFGCLGKDYGKQNLEENNEENTVLFSILVSEEKLRKTKGKNLPCSLTPLTKLSAFFPSLFIVSTGNAEELTGMPIT